MCPEEKDKILVGESKLSETPKKPQYPVTKTKFVYDDAGNSQHEINKKLWEAFQNQIVTSGTTTIGSDGYWYVDGVKTDIKAIGVPGRDGKNGKDGIDGKDGKDGKDGRDADIWTIGADDFWYVNGRKTIFKSRGEDGKSPLLRISTDGQSLEISSDGGQTWLPFEKNFNKLRVLGYVSSVQLLPRNANIGDIYGVWNPDVYSGRVDEEGHLIQGAYDLYVNTVRDWVEDYHITKVYDYDTELPSSAANGTTVLVPVDYLTLDKTKIDGYKVYRFSLDRNGWVLILDTAEIYASKDDIINYGDNVYALVQGDEEHTYKLYRRDVGWVYFGTNASITYVLVQDVNEGTETNILSGKAVTDAYGRYIESPEFVRAYLDSEDKILWGIRTDGTVYFGAGVPPQVKDYIEERIGNYNDVITFLDDLEEGDETLRELLNGKVDKEEGKSLIDEEYAEGIHYIENPEFVEVKLDQDDRILEAIMSDGTKLLPAGYKVGGNVVKTVSNPEYLAAWLDSSDHILFALKADGDVIFGCGVPSQIKEYANKLVEMFHYEDNPEFVDFKLDNENKVLEGIKNDGTKVFPAGVETLKVAIEGSTVESTNNPEYIDIKTDSEGKILEGIRNDGTKYLGSLDIGGITYSVVSNPEWLKAIVDSENKIICGIRTDGTFCAVNIGFLDPSNKILEILNHIDVIDNPEFMSVELDAEEKILGGRSADGTKFENIGINFGGNVIKSAENPEFLSVELSTDEKILSGRKIDGTKFENVGLDLRGTVLKGIDDPEGRMEIKTDSNEKIISYRKDDGTLVENAGIETPLINLQKEGIDKLQEDLKNNGFISDGIYKPQHLPKYGKVDIKTETFYLTYNENVSSKSDVYIIQDLPDTDQNAANLKTIAFYYVKGSLIDNGDGTYSKYNDGVEGHDIKLTFYAATKVTYVSSVPYVTSTLTEIIDPVTGDITYEVNENSIRVVKIIDSPDVRTWPVDKKTEHHCIVDVDFGSFYKGTNLNIGVKFQGSSTLAYRKRNFRFTFYKNSSYSKKDKIKIGELIRQSGFNLKANWTDPSRVKETILYRLAVAIWDNRDYNNRYPWIKDNPYSGATGLIKCFPMRVDVGGNFYGLDVFGLKKDEKNYILKSAEMDGDVFVDANGMFVSGTGGVYRDGAWNDGWSVNPNYWEDEMNDDEFQIINGHTEADNRALLVFLSFVNDNLYKGSDDNEYILSEVANVGSDLYVKDTLVPSSASVTATRTNDPAYQGSDGNLYILSELTNISGVLYVTSTLSGGQPTPSSVTATPVTNHNIYLGSDGNRYLSFDLTTINDIKYVTDLIVWETTAQSIPVELIPFDKDNVPERMDVYTWIDYFIMMQTFVIYDNTSRNTIMYSGVDRKKMYAYLYDLDLAWKLDRVHYNDDILQPGVANSRDLTLWIKFYSIYKDEIINRYCELRDTVLNVPYIKATYDDIVKYIPKSDVVNESNRWGVGVNVFDISNLINFISDRFNWLDNSYFKV